MLPKIVTLTVVYSRGDARMITRGSNSGDRKEKEAGRGRLERRKALAVRR